MASIGSISPALTTSSPGQLKSTNAAETQKNQFLQLLVAQLKGQNPLDPLDGTQFVSQLAQFSSLEELTSIHAVLKNVETYLKPQTAQNASNSSKIF